MIQSLSRLNITTKLLLFLVAASILPLLIVGIISYNTSRAVIQDEVSNYTQALLHRQEEYLDLLLESIESLIANVSGVEEIKKALLEEEVAQDTYTKLSTHAKIGYILNGYLNLKGLVSIDIFTNNHAHYHVGDTLSKEHIDQTGYQRIYDEALASDKIVLWTGIEDNINVDSKYKKVLIAAKLLKVVDSEELQEKPLGMLFVTYSADSIYNHFHKMDLGEGAYLLIIDAKHRLIYHPDKQAIGSRLSPVLVAELQGYQGSLVMNIQGEEMLVTYSKSDKSGWTLISMVPMASLINSTDSIRNTTLTVMLICLGFIIGAASVVNRTTVLPIKNITEMFKQIPSGKPTLVNKHLLETNRTDEIGELMRWFNSFLESLAARQRAEGEMRQAKEEAEAASEKIVRLYEQLQEDNIRLENTLHELQMTQQELVRSEKMAALGQLIAGVAHEINTPLGAIRASINNTSDILEHSLQGLPKLFTVLSQGQQDLFFTLLDRSLQKKDTISMRETRKLKREMRGQLESAGIEDNADTIADMLMDMEVYQDIEPFLPIFQHTEADFVLQMAYDLSGLHKNGQTISLAIDRASKVVFALKNYAHYDVQGEKVTAQVKEGIETVLTLYHNQLKQGVEVSRLYDDIPPIPCYPDELNQVWTNLIHNALQAMEYKGILEVQTTQENTSIIVRITDSGKGIPAEVQQHMFEPFYTTKPAGEGSGLGLSIVRSIIDKHEGTITVESETGKTSFIVRLPMVQEIN